MKRVVLALLACIILLANSFTMLETKGRLQNDKYEYGAAYADPISALQEPAKSRLDMVIFSDSPFSYVNFRGLNESDSIKGFLRDAVGNGIADREISVYADSILVGRTTTDSHGCFYFNNWDNAKLKPLFDKNEGKTTMGIKVRAVFTGDQDYKRSMAYKRDYMYLIPVTGPTVQYSIVTKEGSPSLELTASPGGSVYLPIIVKPLLQLDNTKVKVRNIAFSLDALPCSKVQASIIHNAVSIPKNIANATVHISVEPDARPGHYAFGIMRHAIMKAPNGQEWLATEKIGILHLTIKPAVSVTEKQCSVGDLPAGSRAGPYIRILMSMHTNKTSGNEMELKASESANVTIYLTSVDNPDARNLIDHLSGCKLHILQAGEIHYPYSTDTIPAKMPIGTDAKLDKQTLMIKPINGIAKEARLDGSFILDQATLTINTNSSVKPGTYLIGIPVRGFSGVEYEAILVFRLTLA